MITYHGLAIFVDSNAFQGRGSISRNSNAVCFIIIARNLSHFKTGDTERKRNPMIPFKN